MNSNTTMPALLTQPALLATKPGVKKSFALFKLVAAVALMVLLYVVFLR